MADKELEQLPNESDKQYIRRLKSEGLPLPARVFGYNSREEMKAAEDAEDKLDGRHSYPLLYRSYPFISNLQCSHWEYYDWVLKQFGLDNLEQVEQCIYDTMLNDYRAGSFPNASDYPARYYQQAVEVHMAKTMLAVFKKLTVKD